MKDARKDQEQKILDFLKRHHLMVISTINSKGEPQSAVVGFTERPNLEIIFGTYNATRKYKNLQENSKISLVIGWDSEEKITIQYEGIAKEAKQDDSKEYQQLHIEKRPKRGKHVHDPRERVFRTKPTWIRYSDLSKDPEEIIEITFND